MKPYEAQIGDWVWNAPYGFMRVSFAHVADRGQFVSVMFPPGAENSGARLPVSELTAAYETFGGLRRIHGNG